MVLRGLLQDVCRVLVLSLILEHLLLLLVLKHDIVEPFRGLGRLCVSAVGRGSRAVCDTR